MIAMPEFQLARSKNTTSQAKPDGIASEAAVLVFCSTEIEPQRSERWLRVAIADHRSRLWHHITVLARSLAGGTWIEISERKVS